MDEEINDVRNERVFLIDTENISTFEFIDRYKVGEGDELIFFLSKNSKNINPKDFVRIIENKSKKEFEYVEVGLKNALDYQLVVYLTKRVVLGDRDVYVVSNDKGYLIALDYLRKDTECEIILVKEEKELLNSEKALQQISGTSSVEEEELEAQIEKILKEERAVLRAINVINKAPEVRRLSYVHNGFIEAFGNAEGKRLYDTVKKSLRKYYLTREG